MYQAYFEKFIGEIDEGKVKGKKETKAQKRHIIKTKQKRKTMGKRKEAME